MKKFIYVCFLFVITIFLISCNATVKVTFKSEDGSVIKTIEVKKGESITDFPAVTPPTGYVFVGWDKELKEANQDEILTAIFEKAKFKVKFVDENGNELLTTEVEYGKSVTAPKAPEKDKYVFAHWDKDLDNITEDCVIKPVYEYNYCKVIFQDENGNSLAIREVERGKSVTSPEAPVKEKYVFIGWDKDLNNITEDCVVKPIYEYNYVEVKFYVNEELYKTIEVEKGKAFTLPDNPILEGYDFVGWDKDLTSLTENTITNAIFKKQMLKVSYLTEFGDEICELEYDYNEELSFPEPIDVPGYTFEKWDTEKTNVVKNFQVTALYKINTYNIKYYDGKDQVNGLLDSYTITDIVYLEEIEKEGYIFSGWYDKETNGTRLVSFDYNTYGDKVLYAKFEKANRDDIQVLKGDFEITSILKIPHSTNPNLIVHQPVLPANAPSQSKQDYTYEILDTKLASVSQFSTITPLSPGITYLKLTYKKDTTKVGYGLIRISSDGITSISYEEATKIVTHKVYFRDGDNNVFQIQTVKDGFDAILPTPPLKEGKGFSGYSGDFYNVTKDVYVRATYDLKQNRFLGKTVSILGDSISTYKGVIPSSFASFYPYATCDVTNVNQTWWMQVINKFGMKLLMNNSYSGSCVTRDTDNMPAVTDSRLSYLVNDKEQKPDIIFIFMGTNDCASRYVNYETFKQDYKIMMQKIKALCPDSEIFIMQLTYSVLFTQDKRIKYNNTISDYANEFGCHIISLDEAYSLAEVDNYLCDSIHPNKKGMTAIYNCIFKYMKKLV